MPSNVFISRCPDDILLEIFSATVHSPQSHMNRAAEFNPLTLARFASQVCNRWRRLVLSSSPLWGKLLDLNDLDQKSNHWRDEVLARTGQARLHVQVILDPQLPQVTSFFFRIMDEEWPRIQDFHVYNRQGGCLDDNRWLTLQRPTETLRSFRLWLPDQNLKYLHSSNSILFSDHAPSLHYLEIHPMAFRLPAKGFSQLRILRLVGPFLPRQFLLSFCQTFPVLEYLTVGFEESETLHDLWPNVQFPRLQDLKLHGRLATCLRVLEHITAPEHCGLSLSTLDQHFVQPASSISEALSPFLKNHTPSRILLRVSSVMFTFRLDSPKPPHFDLNILCREPFLKSTCFEAVLGCPFSQVTRLKFKARSPSNLASSDSNFRQFIASFSSVTELVATPKTLQLLVQVGNLTNGIILPALKDLRLSLLDPEMPQKIVIFLDWRKAAGVPLESLDLRAPLGRKDLDFSELERFTGMVVKWGMDRMFELYTCGSGNAQRLNFSKPPQ
ncbi:hypothetical protein M413DRAFT_445238 [Hebeloma cylindrosporum]|uniref:F-box domain-containing protein n=1 Tax=Hebeloma cylindrosporum TaxID=76867 RepID=A0A0C2YM43_HEBCY|nr:hypothetical protein M413DRAFT_445238 [Hebeloma cylindrosporum h7]